MNETAATADEPEFVRVSAAARRLNLSPSTLVAAIERGELDGFRLGPRGHWRIKAASLKQLTERSSR